MSDEIRLRHGIHFSAFGIQFDSKATRIRLENTGEINYLWVIEWTGPQVFTAMEFLRVGNLTYTGQLAASVFPAGTVLVIMEEEVPLQGEKP